MDMLSSNANYAHGNRNNVVSQQQLLSAVLPFDGNFSSSLDHQICIQLRQQQQQRRGQPLNRDRDFSSAASTTAAPMLVELKRQWTERALLHRALILVHNDAVACQSLAHLQQSSLTNAISSQPSSGSTLAPLSSSTLYHPAPFSEAEVVFAGADSVVPPKPYDPPGLVMASQLYRGDASEAPLASVSVAGGAVAYSMSSEKAEKACPSKPSERARDRKGPWKAATGEVKRRFGSKRLPNVQVSYERRCYNAESFAQKLFHLITDQERSGNKQIVEFVDGGGGFWLRQPDAISKLMPKYNFRGSKLSGFRRQLYSYGFRVEKDGPNRGAFKHPLFSRGNAELCKQMKRDNRYDYGPYDLDSCDENEKSQGLEGIEDDMS